MIAVYEKCSIHGQIMPYTVWRAWQICCKAPPLHYQFMQEAINVGTIYYIYIYSSCFQLSQPHLMAVHSQQCYGTASEFCISSQEARQKARCKCFLGKTYRKKKSIDSFSSNPTFLPLIEKSLLLPHLCCYCWKFSYSLSKIAVWDHWLNMLPILLAKINSCKVKFMIITKLAISIH